MDPKTKDILRHLRGEAVIALAIFLVAISFSYLEDLVRYLERPKWLVAGIEIVSIILFTIDAIYVLSITAIAVYYSIISKIQRK